MHGRTPSTTVCPSPGPHRSKGRAGNGPGAPPGGPATVRITVTTKAEAMGKSLNRRGAASKDRGAGAHPPSTCVLQPIRRFRIPIRSFIVESGPELEAAARRRHETAHS